MPTSEYWVPSQWVTSTLIYCASTVCSFLILKSEYTQRSQYLAKFPTEWFRWFSILCILCGFVAQLSYSLRSIPWLCVISAYLGTTFSFIQGLFMGLYQLYRLHYCFANESLQSTRGYPNGCLSLCIQLVSFVS